MSMEKLVSRARRLLGRLGRSKLYRKACPKFVFVLLFIKNQRGISKVVFVSGIVELHACTLKL